MEYLWLWLVAAGAFTALCLTVLVRTLRFRPRPAAQGDIAPVAVERDRVIGNLQALVRCRTVSRSTPVEEDEAEFAKLEALLPQLYPAVFRTCSLRRFPGRALLFHWRGRSEEAPAVLMAHYDVVPADESAWEKPPFAGILEDGVLWGRGTLDTKVTVNGVLAAAEHLIEKGFIPQNGIYFAFSGGEEVNGCGAASIVDWFEKEGIVPALVLDEGGAVVENVFPGVKQPCGLVGIAEKGMLNLSYTAVSAGGHASAPPPHTPVGELSAACCRVEAHPFKGHITPPVAEMFDTLGRHSTFVYRMIFANLWLFGGVLDGICRKSGGELNALMRTTVAFTQMQGSEAPNVIPPRCSMVSNMRLNPADTMESAAAYIKRTVKNDQIEIKVLNGMDPSRISRTDTDGFARVCAAIRGTWEGTIVSPYLMVQCSDSRHWGRISDRVYRFSAMDLTAEERRTIHGNNERIRTETAVRAVEFYVRLMEQC